MASITAKNLIIDTDIFSDVDDAAALLLGSTLPGVNLLGVNVNYPSSYSVSAASAILAHYGHETVPLSAPRPLHGKTFFDNWRYELGEFCSKVAYHWTGGSAPFGEAEKALESVDMYRKVLASADDGSVTIASIGFLDSLSALLNSSADSHSALDGRALAQKKVTELVVMGGSYPKGRRSWNFYGSNPAYAAHVINTWPGPITFVGDNVGRNVLSGGPLMHEGPETDPVRMAMIWYSYTRSIASWDPLTIIYAAKGLGDLFEYGSEEGYNRINGDGSNTWVVEPSAKHHRFLRLKVSNEATAELLDREYLKAATMFSKNKPANPVPQIVLKEDKRQEPLGWRIFLYLMLFVMLCLISWPVYRYLAQDRYGLKKAQSYTAIEQDVDRTVDRD